MDTERLGGSKLGEALVRDLDADGQSSRPGETVEKRDKLRNLGYTCCWTVGRENLVCLQDPEPDAVSCGSSKCWSVGRAPPEVIVDHTCKLVSRHRRDRRNEQPVEYWRLTGSIEIDGQVYAPARPAYGLATDLSSSSSPPHCLAAGNEPTAPSEWLFLFNDEGM